MHRQRIEGLAASRNPRPISKPLNGALVVGFFAGLVGGLVLSVAGDPDLSEHRLEAIAGAVALISGGLAYLFLRSQETAFYTAVEREHLEAWRGYAGQAYREGEASQSDKV